MITHPPKKLTIPANTTETVLIDSITNSTITLNENSHLTFIVFTKTGWQDLQKINFEFHGPGAELNFLAIIIGRHSDKFPFETISRHIAPKTKSHFSVRSAMFDKSEIDYRGILDIEKTANQTDSYLAHHTLMLSKNAKTRTIPSLEIQADDVKAGHAATIGKVDNELLFYLQTRGIDKRQGQDMLIKGFMEADLRSIADTEIRTELARKIEASLAQPV